MSGRDLGGLIVHARFRYINELRFISLLAEEVPSRFGSLESLSRHSVRMSGCGCGYG